MSWKMTLQICVIIAVTTVCAILFVFTQSGHYEQVYELIGGAGIIGAILFVTWGWFKIGDSWFR